MSYDVPPERVYRSFSVRRVGFMQYQPVYVTLDEAGEPHCRSLGITFLSRAAALRVAAIANTQYTDGLFAVARSRIEQQSSTAVAPGEN
jgi:hypothetical protein